MGFGAASIKRLASMNASRVFSIGRRCIAELLRFVNLALREANSFQSRKGSAGQGMAPRCSNGYAWGVSRGDDMACPHATQCPLYEQFLMRELARPWVLRYCEGQFQNCERYKLSAQGKPVPLTLLPNGTQLASRPPEAPKR
jgi:hypothetical protein